MAKTKANKEKSTDILALIEAEHRQVENLLAEAEKSKGAKLVEQFNKIYIAVILHARTEELVFYPALREYEETEQYVEEAEEEHEEVSFILEEIKALKPTNPEFKEKMLELKETLEHHVQEEESEIFNAVRECMSDKELTELGQEFQETKDKLVSNVEAALAM
ncbi:hemerythrin domain-containing protein [Nostoc sp. UCD121]|uniref:hemerythrin domain-containing protein n=1 Tax=unclassified Nostoc TaxID=2593658 RepID=UPI00162A9EA7|nr:MULTISPECIES: hemerythrin domain-containing protein [unclassified Nostoc]MBC1219801.1 hemerythrin domain-containing protein [Nostoc sp. UCD120]MBC1275885.1 hemerythrin domain-containing protein [Nostoc sp. UCD121]MBC1294554.1 hemerythrin domain-containing protein [Nostoc sp. UCD122]